MIRPAAACRGERSHAPHYFADDADCLVECLGILDPDGWESAYFRGFEATHPNRQCGWGCNQ